MQAAVRTFLEQELAQVGRRNEVIRLRMEAIRAIVRVVSLALVEARLAVGPAAFFAHAQRAALRPVDTLIRHGFLADLAAVDVYSYEHGRGLRD